MVKIMYKETAKSEKKPILLVVLWFVFIYVFYIAWGITEILLEIKSPFYVKHIILFFITTYLGWKIISKFITEYDYTADKNEFTATKRLGRKQKLVAKVKYKNIVAIYDNEEKENLKNHTFQKKLDITKAYQNGKLVHIVYTFDSQMMLLTMKGSRKLIKLIKDNHADTEDKNI